VRAGLDELLQERSHQQQPFSLGHLGWRVVAAGVRKSGSLFFLLQQWFGRWSRSVIGEEIFASNSLR
jgi:hypothetical protein